MAKSGTARWRGRRKHPKPRPFVRQTPRPAAAKRARIRAGAKPPERRKILRPPKGGWWAVLITALALAAAPVWAVESGLLPWWIGVLAVLVPLLAALAAGLVLLPNSIYLSVYDTGFTAKGLFNLYACRWDQIERFGLVRFDYVGPRVGLKMTYPEGRAVAADPWGRPLGPFDGVLPSNYGKSASELTVLMEKWRKRSASGRKEAGGDAGDQGSGPVNQRNGM